MAIALVASAQKRENVISLLLLVADEWEMRKNEGSMVVWLYEIRCDGSVGGARELVLA